MKFDEVSHDRKTEAEPAIGYASFSLPKWLKKMRQAFRVDALACIGNSEFKTVALILQGRRDGPSLRREFQRIGDKVPDNLLTTLGIQLCHLRFVRQRAGTVSPMISTSPRLFNIARNPARTNLGSSARSTRTGFDPRFVTAFETPGC